MTRHVVSRRKRPLSTRRVCGSCCWTRDGEVTAVRVVYLVNTHAHTHVRSPSDHQVAEGRSEMDITSEQKKRILSRVSLFTPTSRSERLQSWMETNQIQILLIFISSSCAECPGLPASALIVCLVDISAVSGCRCCFKPASPLSPEVVLPDWARFPAQSGNRGPGFAASRFAVWTGGTSFRIRMPSCCPELVYNCLATVTTNLVCQIQSWDYLYQTKSKKFN